MESKKTDFDGNWLLVVGLIVVFVMLFITIGAAISDPEGARESSPIVSMVFIFSVASFVLILFASIVQHAKDVKEFGGDA